jgi:uncharacterized protein (TIGR02246 family)
MEAIMSGSILRCFAVATLVACGSAPPNLSSRAADDAGNFWQRYISVELASDVEGLVRLHTADAQILPADGSVLRGHDAIRTMLAGYFPAVRATVVDIDVEEAWMAGDSLLHVATYREVFEDAEGNSFEDAGRFFAVLVPAPDGGWLIARLLIQSTKG